MKDATDILTAEEVFRLTRLKRGISQKELARHLGITAPFVHDLENGHRRLKEKHVPLLPVEVRKPVVRQMIRQHKEAIKRLQAMRLVEP